MTASYDDVQSKILDQLKDDDLSPDAMSTQIKNLKTLAETQQILKPDPTPEPEPKGLKGFFEKHADALIKVGGTVTAILLIGAIETKGDVIFRSKASKFI